MRVIAGSARGRALTMPKGVEVRPITSMIKEALFNILGQDIVDCRFLDLFAGSGSVGIEALSRGAGSVVFVDENPVCVNTIKTNLAHCGFGSGFTVYRNDALKAIEILAGRKELFDIVYADPPFGAQELYSKVLKVCGEKRLLEEGGRFIIRSSRQLELPARCGFLELSDQRRYGDSVLHFYEMETPV